jgi:hypothetical protein
MTNAISVLQLMPLTKEQKKSFVQKAVTEITSGEYNPLQIEVWLKSIEDTINDIRKDRDVKIAVQFETDKYTEKTFSDFGATITKATRTTKDYSNCNDAVLNGLYSEMEKLKAVIKGREIMLDSGVNPETGETFEKPILKVTEYLKIEVK